MEEEKHYQRTKSIWKRRRRRGERLVDNCSSRKNISLMMLWITTTLLFLLVQQIQNDDNNGIIIASTKRLTPPPFFGGLMMVAAAEMSTKEEEEEADLAVVAAADGDEHKNDKGEELKKDNNVNDIQSHHTKTDRINTNKNDGDTSTATTKELEHVDNPVEEQDGNDEEEEEEDDDADDDDHDDSSSSAVSEQQLEEENGILILRKVDDFRRALLPPSKEEEDAEDDLLVPPLMLLILYSSACQHSSNFINKVEQVKETITSYYVDNIIDSKYQLLFGKLDLHTLQNNNEDDQTWIEENIINNNKINNEKGDNVNNHVSIDRTNFPLLLFVRGYSFHEEDNDDEEEEEEEEEKEEGNDDTIRKDNDVTVNKNMSMNMEVMDYFGKQTESEQIFKTVLHYWYRFIVTDMTIISAANNNNVNGKSSNLEDLDSDSLSSSLFVMSSYKHMIDFLNIHGYGLFHYIKPELHPEMTNNEKQYVSWLLSSKEEKEEIVRDNPYVLFIQCRSSSSSSTTYDVYYEYYDGLAQIMTNRHDVAFFTLENNCKVVVDSSSNKNEDGESEAGSSSSSSSIQLQDGEVISWLVMPSSSSSSSSSTTTTTHEDWNSILSINKSPMNRFVGTTSPKRSDIKYEMTKFVVKETTPLMMWFDRPSVAPIAFPYYRKTHAILFVDMHNLHRYDIGKLLSGSSTKRGTKQSDEESKFIDSALMIKNAIQNFRKAALFHCRQRRRRQDKQRNTYSALPLRQKEDDMDMVFLIVPSTETRIMNTFGIDIWTPLDDIATRKSEEGESEAAAGSKDSVVLPTLLITDQRFGGTQRHYLHATDINKNTNSKAEIGSTILSPIEQFVRDFWDGKLLPKVLSQNKRHATKNISGVQVLTGNTFEEMVLGRPTKHTLLYLFAPTCGHCKRFSLLWNEVSRLIRYLEWDSFIDIMKMDITQNEILVTERFPFYMDIQETPDVYYFPTNEKDKPVRYDIVDDFGDGVGRLSDPMVFLEWFLDVSQGKGLDETMLLRMLGEDAD